MLEKELMHDLHEKREIRKNVADRQKDIDKSKDDTKDDLEVYMAAKDMISRYRLAYRLNLVEPGQAGKIHADQILRSDVSNKLVDHRKLYRKYLRMYPAAAKRANIVLSNFDSLKKEIDNDITKLKKLIDSKRFYRVGNIGPNLDRIASRINTAEEKVRIKAEKEISQQNTSSLVEESAKEMATKQTQKGREKVAPKMYMKRDGDRFIFTKESNPVKIHEVMSAFIKEKPEAVFLLDYNGCIGNDSLKADIKRRTKNNSGKVYIKYNQKIKTYDFFDGTTKEPLGGKRPYIWEGVTMISKEVEGLVAQKQQQDRLDASTNINYAKLAAGNLEKNFEGQIKILQDIKLTRSSSFWDEIKSGEWYGTETHPTRAKDFLVCVETRLNDVVNKWRARAYLDNKNPIDTGGGILQVRLITSSGDLTKVPLFVKDANRGAARGGLPDYLYEYISHRKSQTQEYLTRRLNEIWGERKHMERRDSDVGYEKQSLSTDEKLREKQKKDIEKNKDLKKYGIDSLLDMLAQLEKDKHTPPEIGPLLAHVEGIKKSLENSPKNSLPSKATWDAAIKETQRLYIVYKNNDGRFATITDATAKKLIEQIFNAKSRVEVQNARSELGNGMTFFDNSSRSGAVSDYADDMMESNQSYYKNGGKDGKGLLEIVDEDNKGYNDCYQNICRLTYIDVDEKTGEITGPQENKKFIDDLMACDDRISLGTLLKSKNLIPKNLEKEDSNKYYEICTTILKTIENKREMENKFELTADDMKKSYMAEINELQKKTSLTDEEMARMALLMCIIEDDEGLKESAKGQTQIGKDTIRYGGIDSLLDEHITPYLAKKGGGFKGGNEAMTRNYNDSKGLRGWWDRTDENCEKIGPVLKEILTEVVITAVAIGLGAVTGGLGTAAVAGLRTLAGGARIASIGNKVKNFTRIAKLCEKMGKGAKYCKKLKSTAKAKIWGKVGDTRFGRAYSRAQTLSRTKVVGENAAKNVGRGLAGLSENTKAGRAIAQCAEWAGGTKLFKAGKTIGEVVKLGNIARKEGSLGMKAVGMIFEGTGFHVVSTALHNALEGRDILADLDPRYNFRGYVQSIAFLGVLRFLGKPINTMTNTTMQFVMGQRISATQFGNALKYVAGLGGEFGTLCATDQALSVGFGEGFKEMTLKDAIHSIGIILGLRLHGRIKQLRSITIKEYNRERGELKVDFGEGVVTLNEDEILLDNNGERGENNISKGEDISPKLLEEMSAKVHEERLKRNPRAKGSELDKLYYELPESEKLKDRDHILQAIEKIGGREKRFEIEGEFKERQKIEEQQRRVKEEQEGKKEEITDNDNPGNIADKLEKSMDNGTDFEVSKEAFVSGRFIEGIKNWFNKNIQRPDFSLPRNSINRLKNKISEMMKNRGNELSDGYKKLMERFGKYLNDLLKQPGERIEIKKQQKERRRVREEQQRRVREGQQRRAREEQQRRAREEQSRILNQNKRPDRGINTERREMSEVQRISDVVAIGDLHGEYEALKGNMEYAGLAREINGHLERTGGNKKVVFQGDILADRGTDGLRIIQEIHKLREQARQQGGDIDIIVGNHDDFMISYLTGRNGIHGKGLDIASYGQQGKGLTELAKFIGRKVGDFDSLYGTGIRQEIFQAMRNNSEGRLILEEICNMKLVSQVDDVLYIHTNPTAKMLESLTRGNVQSNINSINQKYQGYLRNALLGEGNGSISLEEFNNISDIFLDTNNRPKYGSEVGLDNYCTILNNQGINMILHGHSGGAGRTIERSGIKIVDIDYGYGKRGQINGKEHSVSVIKKEGGVNYMGDNVANANLEHPIGSEVYVDFGNPKMQKGKVNSYNPKTKEYTVVLDGDTDIGIVLKAENLRNVGKNEYFGKKSHKFNVTEGQARENSRRSDEVARETDESKKYQKRQELANEIARQYKEATGKDLELTDSQVKAILEAHNMEGNLGELERGQVRARNTKLKEAGIRKNVRRFLMEAGFCGKINLHESMNGLGNGINGITENIKNMNQQLQGTKVQLTEIKNLFDKINSTTTVNPEDIQNVVQKIRNLEDNIGTKFENLDQIISRETNGIPDILRQLYNNGELIKDQSGLQITESVWKSLETQWNELKILNETVGEIYYNLHNYEYIADRILGKSGNFNEGIKLKKNIAYLRGFLERFNYLSGSINHSRSWIESFWNESYKQANNYFDGKSHRFNVTEIQARGNSKMMDNLLNEINREGFSQEEISSKLEELRKKISEQYEQATGEKLELTDEQLLSVLDAHEQDGKLGELSLGQLRVKVKLLAETIKNDKVRRFLLEAGFCGQEGINDNYTSDINELAKKLNLKQYEIENIEKSIELINKTPIQNGIRLGELPITEILNNNYEGIKDLVKFIPGPYQVLIFFRDYLALPNQKLGQLEYERNKKLQEILSNFSEDIKNKCKNAGIDIDEKLRILKGEISLEEAKQICTDEKIIKLAQNKEGIINKHALELAMKLSNWKIHTNEIGLIFELGNNEYTKIKELIKHLEKELSNANLSINNVGEIIQVGENHGKYRFEYLLKIYLIDGRRLTNHYKMGDIKHNLAISLMTNSLWDHYREYKGERRENLTNLIYQSAYAYMSKEEKQALGDYKKTGKGINKTANDPNNETSKIISQYLERMPLKEDIEVERKDPKFGIAGKIKLSMNGETKTLSEILDTGEKCDETNLEQSSFIRDSFISTTVHNYQTAPIVWHFTVKKGVGATYLDVLGFNSEGEVLLDKNCKITITKLDASGGGAHIYATVEKI